MNRFTMFLCLFIFLMVTSSQANHEGRKVYIIYMGALSSSSHYVTIKRHHLSLLRSVTGESYTPSLIVANYGKSFDGFAAWLTEDESNKLSAMPAVVSVFPKLKLHTDVDMIKDGAIDSGVRSQNLAPL
ncbi:Subtilisin-like protease SBT4.6 [Cardamine amara subsp. amara]|uniref:Subtilisin-like protease SBT4.6 n=1 Tax=Cardamine amara subsp. amara TaxID=228776 RepID=A0ABD1B3A4_CARAN